jgi:hypothetical protein
MTYRSYARALVVLAYLSGPAVAWFAEHEVGGDITTPAALRAMIDYLHANPVRRGLVSKAEDWEWSSARWYAGMRPVKIEMDEMIMIELARDG